MRGPKVIKRFLKVGSVQIRIKERVVRKRAKAELEMLCCFDDGGKGYEPSNVGSL